MENGFIYYRNSKIHYYRFGRGNKPVLAFHGYGEDSSSFCFLENYADEAFTFYCIDLPYHGLTEWNESRPFIPGQLWEIIDQLTQVTGMQIAGSNKCRLLGFSLGGRISLSLYQFDPGRVDMLVLLAPDGIKVNFWYWLVTQTWAGNRLFRFTMKYPGWFFSFLKLLNRTGLVNASIFKFVKHYIGNEAVREQLYLRWTSLRKFRPHLGLIKLQLRKEEASVRLLYGKHDRIILPVRGEKFRKHIEERCQLSILDTGHQVLQEKWATNILSLLAD